MDEDIIDLTSDSEDFQPQKTYIISRPASKKTATKKIDESLNVNIDTNGCNSSIQEQYTATNTGVDPKTNKKSGPISPISGGFEWKCYPSNSSGQLDNRKSKLVPEVKLQGSLNTLANTDIQEWKQRECFGLQTNIVDRPISSTQPVSSLAIHQPHITTESLKDLSTSFNTNRLTRILDSGRRDDKNLSFESCSNESVLSSLHHSSFHSTTAQTAATETSHLASNGNQSFVSLESKNPENTFKRIRLDGSLFIATLNKTVVYNQESALNGSFFTERDYASSTVQTAKGPIRHNSDAAIKEDAKKKYGFISHYQTTQSFEARPNNLIETYLTDQNTLSLFAGQNQATAVNMDTSCIVDLERDFTEKDMGLPDLFDFIFQEAQEQETPQELSKLENVVLSEVSSEYDDCPEDFKDCSKQEPKTTPNNRESKVTPLKVPGKRGRKKKEISFASTSKVVPKKQTLKPVIVAMKKMKRQTSYFVRKKGHEDIWVTKDKLVSDEEIKALEAFESMLIDDPNSSSWEVLQGVDSVTFLPSNIVSFVEMFSQSEGPPITVVNEFDDSGPPENFTVINKNIYGKGVKLPEKLAKGCQCIGVCDPKSLTCSCIKDQFESYYASAYNRAGRMKLEKNNAIYECNSKCSCSLDCTNRVVQRGQEVKLQIFKTPEKGWGIRASQKIRKGCFIIEYVGEVITTDEAERRGEEYDERQATYLFDLDFEHGQAEDCIYSIDASHFGNVSHFFNHSCDPNMAVYPVFTDACDSKLHRLAFFATKNINSYEELTFDYYPQTQFNRTIADYSSEKYQCRCGSSNCRGYFHLVNTST